MYLFHFLLLVLFLPQFAHLKSSDNNRTHDALVVFWGELNKKIRHLDQSLANSLFIIKYRKVETIV